jgi:hypothetical protein
MPATMVHASLAVQRSDGNYGHERAEASLSYDLEPGQDACDVLAVLQAQVRERVEHELAQSLSATVRQSVYRPDWHAAEASAEYELAAGLRDNARQGDDADDEDLPY